MPLCFGNSHRGVAEYYVQFSRIAGIFQGVGWADSVMIQVRIALGLEASEARKAQLVRQTSEAELI